MKRKFFLKLLIIFFICIIASTSSALAKKEDLEDTDGNGFSAKEFRELREKAYEVYDTNDEKKKQEFIQSLTDAEINVLTNPTANMLNGGAIDGKYSKMSDWIMTEWKRRADEYGIEYDDSDDSKYSGGMVKYYEPDKKTPTSSSSSIDDAINDANDFVKQAESDIGIVEESSLQKFSNSFYNIFLIVGTAIAVIVGIVIGITYMLGSIEEKADIKEMLIPYAVGCTVIFGAFGIWKMVIEIMNNIL